MALRSIAQGELFAEVLGEGDPVILALHGWGRRGTDFAKSLGDVPGLALDLPGFGASPAPTVVAGAREYAEMIRPALREFDRPPVVVGHSFGGRVAVCLAAAYPDEVGSLVLTGVPLLRRSQGRGPSLSYRIIRGLHRLGLVSDDRMERIRQARGSDDYRAASGVMRSILVKVVNESYEEELAALNKPVYMVWGSDDRDAPVEIAEAASEILADSQLRVLDGVGHMLPLQAPDVLRSITVEALR